MKKGVNLLNPQKKLLFLVNPHAGKSAVKNQLLSILDTFVKGGYLVTVHTTQRAGELTALVRDAAEDYDMVVCSGGDGTMNETINGIMLCDRKPILGYIPAGTTNDFANSFRLPKNMVTAAETITGGVPVFFDVGRFEQKHFAYVAAFGAFTDVTYQTPQDQKNILGKLAYILEGAMRLPTLHSYPIRLEHDNGVIEDDILIGVVTNSSYVAGLPIGRMIDSSMSDGIMEVFLIKNPKNILELAPVINRFLLGEIDQRHVHVIKTTRLLISCDQEIDWTLDGEYGGTHSQIKVENLRCALRLMVPAESVSQ